MDAWACDMPTVSPNPENGSLRLAKVLLPWPTAVLLSFGYIRELFVATSESTLGLANVCACYLLANPSPRLAECSQPGQTLCFYHLVHALAFAAYA